MKRVFVNLIPVFLTVYLFTGFSAFAQYKYDPNALNVITTAVPFLMIGPDARGGGLGDAGVSSTPDANSMHWNPAKYAFIDKDMGFSISYCPWLRALVDDIGLAYLSGYKKIGNDQAIAASLLYFSLGSITFTDNVGTSLGDYKPNEYAIDVCYSRKFSEVISGGVSLRYIHSNLTLGQYVGGAESHAGNSIATDVSAYYQKELEFGRTPAKLGVGLNISNIGNKMSYTETTERDFIPINMRFGPTLTLDLDEYNSLAIMIDINKLLVPTPPVYDSTGITILAGKDPNPYVVSGMFQSFSDAPGGFKEEMKEFTFSPGIEYWYDKQFAIRAGFFYEDKTKGNRKFFTLGAGLKYNVFGLDFAYLIPVEQRNPLENTLRFTLLFDFDAFKDQNVTK
ncbi:MAG: type IX secretion system outer membrane channel protein PorV [Bacteroidales bacterium]